MPDIAVVWELLKNAFLRRPGIYGDFKGHLEGRDYIEARLRDSGCNCMSQGAGPCSGLRM